MADLKARVRNVSSRDFPGRGGGSYTMYSFQVEGDNRFFGCGTKEPAIRENDTIAFTFEQKGKYYNVDVDSIQQVAAEEVQQAPKPSGGAGSAGTTSGNASATPYNPQKDYSNKDNYWARKEAKDDVVSLRINYSASQRDAVSLVSAALAHDCLSFGNAAKGKKLDMLLECVDKVTERFVAQREAAGNEGGE